MIRCIAAIDNHRGIANDQGIPWDLPTDRAYYRGKIANSSVVMGFGTFDRRSKPFSMRTNYVATRHRSVTQPGFVAAPDPIKLLRATKEDIWILGGADIYALTIGLAEELYLTQVSADFHCTKFFPEYKEQFERVSRSDTMVENDTQFWFEVWRRKTTTKKGH